MYQPQPLREPAGSVAADLAMHALRRQLTVYAGAGLSIAPPTSIPGARALAQLIVDALEHQIPLDGVDRNDLVAVADEVAAQHLGLDLLRQTMLRVADFRGAPFNYAHQVLALLLCEGAALVLETNYDDCIERAAQPERPIVVRTSQEMLQADGASLLKAHGCATQPETMLVTQADLDSVPSWASTRVAAQLRSSRVVFVGIGSPADYVCQNVTQLVDEVGVEHLLVVDPSLAFWDGDDPPAWRELLPNLTPEHRDERTAQQFSDALLRAYLDHPRAKAMEKVTGMPDDHPQRTGLEAIIQALWSRDGVWVLRWMRDASHGLAPGVSTATSSELIRGLLGEGCLLGDAPVERLRSGGWLFAKCPPFDPKPLEPLPDSESNKAATSGPSDGGQATIPVLLLMSHGSPLGATIDAEARRRVVLARGEDVVPAGAVVIVVAVGHIGPMSGEVQVGRGARLDEVLSQLPVPAGDVTPTNIVADAEATHLINGPASGAIIMVNGDALIEAA